MKKNFSARLLAALLTSLILASCNLPQSGESIPSTLDVTQAYQTVEARLTDFVALTPSASASPSPTSNLIEMDTPPSATRAPSQTAVASTLTPTAVCNRVAPGNPIDVTIPDDTKMAPDESFTKIWRLKNVGTCTWTRDYSVELFSGEAMGAPASLPLSDEVPPGKSVDISVDMIAPQKGGRYQGNWKLRNASDQWFGIGPNGSSPFWVRIIVVPPATPTPTSAPPTATATLIPTATLTPTVTLVPTEGPTVSPTPVTPTVVPVTPTVTTTSTVLASGIVTMIPADKVGLGSKQLNNGSGEDLSYRSNTAGQHLLVPLSSAVIAVLGDRQPTLDNCQSVPLSAAPLTVEDLTQDIYLCYRTDQGAPGRALLENFNQDNYATTLEILAWALP